MPVPQSTPRPIHHVLIAGAGIGGPALALALRRLGMRVVVVERAPALREGGQAVDFRGASHLAVLERLGVLDAIKARRTPPGDLLLLGRDGTSHVRLPPSFTGGDVEIFRGDLSRVLYDASSADTEYRFGDEITALAENDDGVTVSFARAATGRFDLVVGADGLHSGVRALAFGDEELFLRPLGFQVAGFTVPNFLGLARGMHVFSAPGRGAALSAGRYPDELRALLVFRSPRLPSGTTRESVQMDILPRIFAGVGWHTPRILKELETASDLYVDALSLVEAPRYSRGRIALLGDAGYGGTMGGNGTGLAVLGAYVLAGELGRARDAGQSHQVALEAYETRMRPHARTCQAGARATPAASSRRGPLSSWPCVIGCTASSARACSAVCSSDWPRARRGRSTSPRIQPSPRHDVTPRCADAPRRERAELYTSVRRDDLYASGVKPIGGQDCVNQASRPSCTLERSSKKRREIVGQARETREVRRRVCTGERGAA